LIDRSIWLTQRIPIQIGGAGKHNLGPIFWRVDPGRWSEFTRAVTSSAFCRAEILAPDVRRPNISHAIFDFDGTLSWLRHGWPQIMLQVFLRHAPAEWLNDGEMHAQLLSDILSLNGMPSIHQLKRCCGRVLENGDSIPKPEALLDEYLLTLHRIVSERIDAVRNGTSHPDEFVVCNARRALEILRDHGITLIILSGTVETDVRAEAALLGLSSFFGDHIYGSPQKGAFSKKDVIDQIMREEGINGNHLLAFGDGPVEITFSKAAGGLAIGVASDEEENGSHRMDAAKKQQLIAAGADLVIPDYAEAQTLLAAILGT
jgi:phosphoglycolate phosphatase-like HAD superfamily hydrolase